METAEYIDYIQTPFGKAYLVAIPLTGEQAPVLDEPIFFPKNNAIQGRTVIGVGYITPEDLTNWYFNVTQQIPTADASANILLSTAEDTKGQNVDTRYYLHEYPVNNLSISRRSGKIFKTEDQKINLNLCYFRFTDLTGINEGDYLLFQFFVK